jgi:hypothetical protein
MPCRVHHDRQSAVQPETPGVTVSGLVAKPQTITDLRGGLTLRGAVFAAGGNAPETFGKKAVEVVVTLERGNELTSLSLPLVTHDQAGAILLRPGDKVIVQPWYETDLSRATTLESGLFIENSALLEELTDGKSYSVVLSLPGRSEMVTTKSEDDTVIPLNLGIDFTQSLPERNSVAVVSLQRQFEGRQLEFVLLRSTPRHLDSRTEKPVRDVLQHVTVLPGDSVGIMELRTHPLVFANLLAPLIAGRDTLAQPRAECFPKVHEGIREHRSRLSKLMAPMRDWFGQVEMPALPSLGESLAAPFRR